MSDATYFVVEESPLGGLVLLSDGRHLTGLHLPGPDGRPEVDPTWTDGGKDRVLSAAVRQLREYFAGRRTAFDLPLALAGTPFQQQVWAELQRIPYGETISYRDLAERVGNPRGSRAVGGANGANPVAVVVPCHRVIAAGGGLGGYGGGLDRKRWLLAHERTTA
jgi:methylated-DNA-[protein]-cysteine S-methyltransferase